MWLKPHLLEELMWSFLSLNLVCREFNASLIKKIFQIKILHTQSWPKSSMTFCCLREITHYWPRTYFAGPEWASYNIGVFLCTRCAGIHRGLGAHISKVKHLKLDRWEDSQVEHMKEVGNVAAKFKYEERVPSCYRRPTEFDPQYVINLRHST